MSPGTKFLARNDSNFPSLKLDKVYIIYLFNIHVHVERWVIYQWQVGGTNFVSSSNDFSDLYSCINATDTTIIMAIVMLTASSNCLIHMLTNAEPEIVKYCILS